MYVVVHYLWMYVCIEDSHTHSTTSVLALHVRSETRYSSGLVNVEVCGRMTKWASLFPLLRVTLHAGVYTRLLFIYTDYIAFGHHVCSSLSNKYHHHDADK